MGLHANRCGQWRKHHGEASERSNEERQSRRIHFTELIAKGFIRFLRYSVGNQKENYGKIYPGFEIIGHFGFWFERKIRLFDGCGKEVWLGDAPAGIDRWLGEIKESGLYKIRVSMQCVESFTNAELLRKTPKFKYVPEITGTRMPAR
jgi:hypothetical protein